MNKLILILAVLTCLNLNSAFSSSSEIENAMKEKISSLGESKSFVFVDLGLTKEELRLLKKLKVDFSKALAPGDYNRFGHLHLLKDELLAYLPTMFNNDDEVIQTVTDIITRTVDHVIKASNKNSAWVCVRPSTPDTLFDIPRWHMDGTYYGPYPYPGIVLKFGAVLKGPSTLLYNLPNDLREIFNLNQNDRLFLSELLDLDKAESPQIGEGVFFIVGDDQIGGVHSEPKMDEERLFFSILPGNESEIEELYLKWHPWDTTLLHFN